MPRRPSRATHKAKVGTTPRKMTTGEKTKIFLYFMRLRVNADVDEVKKFLITVFRGEEKFVLIDHNLSVPCFFLYIIHSESAIWLSQNTTFDSDGVARLLELRALNADLSKTFTVFDGPSFPKISCYTTAICYRCHANSTDVGRFCSIDKLCKGSSCKFVYNNDGSWEAGCSSELSASEQITCSSRGSVTSCSCNSDFCNSFMKSQKAVELTKQGTGNPWWGGRREPEKLNILLPDRSLVYCEECGNVNVDGETVVIPCDKSHTCQGNYCVSVRGKSPYSYCGGVWDGELEPACYLSADQPEKCICSMNMCNYLLEPAEEIATTVFVNSELQPTLATIAPPENQPIATTTQKPATKKKCKNAKFSPNDQAVFMGEKLKDAILSGFGEDGAIQNFEDDINDHICNYSEDE
ncbi:unnamed protein product [Caenorhabditis bovis]|uniref:DUF7741 domain-containing protein n=1 Tax=Caenorhabditis bovis TaxID=2654633 RepID=A0A8S1F4Z0_9PELO|nr:unnamed protein product [Caenorhabditis bovis]